MTAKQKRSGYQEQLDFPEIVQPVLAAFAAVAGLLGAGIWASHGRRAAHFREH